MGLKEKNPGSLDRLRQRVRAVGSTEFRGNLNQVVAAGAMTQVQNGFVESRDPYGDPWKPTASRDGQPLRNNGHMASTGHVNQRPDGFSITLDQSHPKTHNYGAVIVPKVAKALRFVVRGVTVFAKKVVIPKRQIFPDARRGLGPIWGPALKRDAAGYLRRAMGVKS